MKRRDFLRGQVAPRSDQEVGIQLYTVRDQMEDDVSRTLEALGSMGYDYVELAGLHGLDARQMRRRLEDVGLRAESSHHDVYDIREGWNRVLDDALELEQSHVVIPWLPGDERDAESLERVADDFNRGGEAAAAVGLRFGYHNHEWELMPLPDGRRPIDLLLSRTDPRHVDWQMDVYWVAHGYEDARAPFWHIERHGDRIRTLHLKDRTGEADMVDVGDGVLDFARLLGLARRESAVMHSFVEHDEPSDSLSTARRSLEHVRSILVPEVPR